MKPKTKKSRRKAASSSAAAQESLKRTFRKSVLFNSREVAAMDEYCKRFGIASRSALIRKSVMECVMRGLDESTPTLF